MSEANRRLMKGSPQSSVLCAVLLGSVLAAGAVSAEPGDLQVATAQASLLKVSAPAWKPRHRDPDARIEATSHGALGRWQSSATFRWDWAANAWRVASYTTRFDGSDTGDDAAAALTEPFGAGTANFPEVPDIPHDPNAPTQPGTIGDSITSQFSAGYWSYTITYAYGIRDGVLGWHITSVKAVYKDPRNPPEDPR